MGHSKAERCGMDEGPEAERPEELDRRIQARRQGDSLLPDAELDQLADISAELRDRWQASPELDEGAIWNRVESEIESGQHRISRAWKRSLSMRPRFFPRAFAAAAAASLLMIAVVAAALLTSGGSASAQFLDDVDTLSDDTTAKLDGGLTPAEVAELAADASALLASLGGEPSPLLGVSAGDLTAAKTSLESTISALNPHSGEPGVPGLLASLGAMLGIVDALVAHDVGSACAGVTDEAAFALCDDAIDLAKGGCDALAEEAEDACEEALHVYEHAVKDEFTAFVAPFDSAESCADLVPLGATEAQRVECDLVVAGVGAWCDTVVDEATLDACEDAIDEVEEACEELGIAEEACEEELDALEDSVALLLALDSCAAIAGDDGAACTAIVAGITLYGAIADEAALDACEDEIDAAEELCHALSPAARRACRSELDSIADAADDALD